jgi:alpha-tubulin suppressor-like RCC1 family protein
MPDLNDLSFIYARYNTTLLVDIKGRVFMWGESSYNLRLRKPKLFHVFTNGVKQIALGKRHGIMIDGEQQVYGWGDGTYGELGLLDDLPVEKPIVLPFFKDTKIQ